MISMKKVIVALMVLISFIGLTGGKDSNRSHNLEQ